MRCETVLTSSKDGQTSLVCKTSILQLQILVQLELLWKRKCGEGIRSGRGEEGEGVGRSEEVEKVGEVEGTEGSGHVIVQPFHLPHGRVV